MLTGCRSRQAGLCSVWGTAFLCLEMNEASPSCLTDRQGPHPSPLYLVTYWASMVRQNHLHQMSPASVALSCPMSLCQDDANGRPNLYSGKYCFMWQLTSSYRWQYNSPNRPILVILRYRDWSVSDVLRPKKMSNESMSCCTYCVDSNSYTHSNIHS